MRQPRCAGRAGFTLIELLVVLAVLGVAILIGYPALDKMMQRSKLEVSARQAAALMQTARFEAIRRGGTAGVKQDIATREVVAFAELDAVAGLSAGDRILNRFTLPTGVEFYGPGDVEAGTRDNAYWNSDPAVPDGYALFGSDGAADAAAAFRFADLRGNFLETRVDPPATARVAVQKYAGSGDPSVEANWQEPGEGGEAWQWN